MEAAEQAAASFSEIWFKLLSVERLEAKQLNWPSDRDFLPTDEPLMVVSATDEGRLVVNGQFVPLRPGSVFVCAPGQLVEAGLPEGEGRCLYLLRFRMAKLRPAEPGELAAERIDVFPAARGVVQLPASAVVPLCEAIRGHWRAGGAAERLQGEAGFYELLGLVAEHREGKTAAALEQTKLLLERHFGEELTIGGLAERAGLSRFHFMRLFKEKYGKGVIETLTERRLQEAKRLMRDERRPSIRDIAFRVGYKNESYFSSLFKKQTGMAPAVYLKNRNTRVAAYSWVNIGQLLALRMIPYAAPIDQYWTDYYRNQFAFEVTVPLSHQYEFNREALRQAPPDAIVAIDAYVPPEEQDKLRQIAPSLFLPWRDDWRRHLRLTAELLNRADEAEKWLERYDRQVARLRESARRTVGDDTVLLVHLYHQRLYVWSRRAGTVLYDDLGLAPARHIDRADWVRSVTADELAEFAADRLIVNVGGDPVSHASWRRLSGSEAWRELPAVRRGRVFRTPGYAGWEAPWNGYAAFNLERQLVRFGKILHEAER